MNNDTSGNTKLTLIDDYIQALFPPDEALLHTLQESQRNDLPAISVSPNEGRLLYMLAKMSGARKILELGTLGGFSTINLARALPSGGKLISLEYSDKHAKVARANIDNAGLTSRVEVRVGAALDSLAQLLENKEGPFDLFFIDADKGNYPAYLDLCIQLARPGSIILSDNLIRDGLVLDPPADNEAAVAIAQFNKKLATNPRLESVILPIVRESVDGLGISIVL
ncbi:MAG TPA: O-methyltransferase [Chloroflexia bacterium]|nr:O-methyltransferase [Chloroflexia bacterium]